MIFPPQCPAYAHNFTAYKNKVKHFLLTVGLSQTPHIAKAKIKCFLFVFVLGKVVATQRWFVVLLHINKIIVRYI